MKLLKKAYIKHEDGDVIISDTKNFDRYVVVMPLRHPYKLYKS